MIDGAAPLVLLAALAIEGALGYPRLLYRRVGHPVGWLARLTVAVVRPCPVDGVLGGLAGAMVPVLTAGIGLASGWGLSRVFVGPLGALAEVAVVAVMLVSRSPAGHAAAVARKLPEGLAYARRAARPLTGRRGDELDGPGVARTALEALADNVCEGVVSPGLWYLAAGLPGLLAYKAVVTGEKVVADCVGGDAALARPAKWVTALLDFVPARTAAAVIALGALASSGLSGRRALATALRHAGRHPAFNAGWPEAALAGAVNVGLRGPRLPGRADDLWLGDGWADAGPNDIRLGLRAYWAAVLAFAACLLAAGLPAALSAGL